MKITPIFKDGDYRCEITDVGGMIKYSGKGTVYFGGEAIIYLKEPINPEKTISLSDAEMSIDELEDRSDTLDHPTKESPTSKLSRPKYANIDIPHYQGRGGIEPIDFISTNNMRFDEGKLNTSINEKTKPSQPIMPKFEYVSLYKVLMRALDQAQDGKGKDRHEINDTEPFECQRSCEITRRVGLGYPSGQAIKKIEESLGFKEVNKQTHEILGAINYLCMMIIVAEGK